MSVDASAVEYVSSSADLEEDGVRASRRLSEAQACSPPPSPPPFAPSPSIPPTIKGAPRDDADSDGIPDADEGTGDSDSDGIPDALDPADDHDSDGILDPLDPDGDGDGIDDAEEGTVDTDSDGIPNYLDPDSDNDGIPDAVEGNTDSNSDGIPDRMDPTMPDNDNDGIPDAVEGTVDTESDGIPNNLDPDSDGDGTGDAEEGSNDANSDGIPDRLDSAQPCDDCQGHTVLCTGQTITGYIMALPGSGDEPCCAQSQANPGYCGYEARGNVDALPCCRLEFALYQSPISPCCRRKDSVSSLASTGFWRHVHPLRRRERRLLIE